MALSKTNKKIKLLERTIKQYKGELTLKILLQLMCGKCYDDEFFEVNFNGKDKGGFGNMMQDRFFGIARNNSKEADFAYEKVELKCTGLKSLKVGVSAKERLILNIINYDEIAGQEYKEAMSKSENMYLIFYLYDSKKKFYDWKIVSAGFLILDNLPKTISSQLQEDFEKIKGKVVSGQAGKISGKDTTYLEACPKGRNKEKSQVLYNGEMVQRRAFAFKSKLLTQIYDEYFSTLLNKS